MAPPTAELVARLRGASTAISDAGVDALIVSTPSNLTYLTGLRMSAGVVVLSGGAATVLADSRYAETASTALRAVPDAAVLTVVHGQSYDEAIAALVSGSGWASVGVEAGHMTLGRAASLRRLGGESGCRWVDTEGVIERLRAVKDPWEQAVLREAGGRLSAVATCILPQVYAGQTERQVAWAVDVALHSAGFERPAFETIVASGPHAARPHHRPTDRRLESGELVLIDFGGVLEGYAVDMSRTLGLGAIDRRRQHWLDAVKAAQTAAIGVTAPGRLPSEIDAAARQVLAVEGLGDHFIHSTGHGLGLDVHERPTIGPRGDAFGPLAPGMVFTVEPGVYVPELGGVRIEDDVLVTAAGAERLTS